MTWWWDSRQVSEASMHWIKNIGLSICFCHGGFTEIDLLKLDLIFPLLKLHLTCSDFVQLTICLFGSLSLKIDKQAMEVQPNDSIKQSICLQFGEVCSRMLCDLSLRMGEIIVVPVYSVLWSKQLPSKITSCTNRCPLKGCTRADYLALDNKDGSVCFSSWLSASCNLNNDQLKVQICWFWCHVTKISENVLQKSV